MKYRIALTIIAKNEKEFSEIYSKIKNYTPLIQIDVMDGKFVKNKSNWFDFKLPKGKEYEAHLMINNPNLWIKNNYNKFDVLIANFEKVKKPFELIKFIKSKNKQIGFAINPETKINQLIPYLKYLNRVLILTIHPGKYGAKFLPEMVNKIKELRDIYEGDIEVDGHMNPETIKLCKKAGANIFAIGSYVEKSNNVSEAISKLKQSLRLS